MKRHGSGDWQKSSPAARTPRARNCVQGQVDPAPRAKEAETWQKQVPDDGSILAILRLRTDARKKLTQAANAPELAVQRTQQARKHAPEGVFAANQVQELVAPLGEVRARAVA